MGETKWGCSSVRKFRIGAKFRTVQKFCTDAKNSQAGAKFSHPSTKLRISAFSALVFCIIFLQKFDKNCKNKHMKIFKNAEK